MKMFDAEAVHRELDYPSLVAALMEHHSRDVDAVQSHLLEQPNSVGSSNIFLTLPAWQHDRAIGAKLITVFPDNEYNKSGLPSVQGVYVLFDGANGEPRACIDGTALTLRKTAADSALGSQFLARNDSRRLLMVGAGAMAPHLIMAHCAVRPEIEHVAIWNRTPERAETLAHAMSLEGVNFSSVADLETAAREADLISCATMSTKPLILGDWLKPGAHVDLVGSFRPDMHECDEAAIRRSSVFLDSRWSALHDSGEIVDAMASGALAPEHILADNFELSRGEHPGRTSNKEITLYKNGGGGHLDLMVAQYLCDRTST